MRAAALAVGALEVIVSVIDADNNRQNVRKTVTVVRGRRRAATGTTHAAGPLGGPAVVLRVYVRGKEQALWRSAALQSHTEHRLQGEGVHAQPRDE